MRSVSPIRVDSTGIHHRAATSPAERPSQSTGASRPRRCQPEGGGRGEGGRLQETPSFQPSAAWGFHPTRLYCAFDRVVWGVPPREACFEQRGRVIGPTPPGTGVIAEAISLPASKSTSPTRRSLFRLMPTSIYDHARVDHRRPSQSSAFRSPPTRMSAWRVMSAMFFVRLWQIGGGGVGDASFWINGTPSACRDDVAPAEDRGVRFLGLPAGVLRSSWQPAGVRGRNRGRPWTSRPTFSDESSRHRFTGRTASRIRSSSTCFEGKLDRMPWTVGSAFSFWT